MVKNKEKILKYTFKTVWWILTVLLVLLLVKVLGAKAVGKVPDIFGYSVMQVVTGSMEPEIPAGSYILVKSTPAEEITHKDIISFYSEDPKIYGIPNTHRVLEIIETPEGREFVTKGDANHSKDKINAKEARLIGVHATNLDFLTDFSNFLSNGGIYAIIIVIWVCTFAIMGYTMYKKLRSEEDTEPENKENKPKE